MKAKYCKCKNKYTINDCDRNCNAMYYWAHGIGSLITEIVEEPTDCDSVFDLTFDSTFRCSEPTENKIFDKTFNNTFN